MTKKEKNKVKKLLKTGLKSFVLIISICIFLILIIKIQKKWKIKMKYGKIFLDMKDYIK